MTASDRLDALLTAIGHPPAETPDLRRFGYDAMSTPYTDDWAMLEPLSRRGWCVHFDAEGQFFEPGEHTRLIQALLVLARVSPLPAVRDTWIAGIGWVFEVQDDHRRVSVHYPEPGRDLPSDYCELWLIKVLIEDWLAGEVLLLDPDTDDQTAFCCMMPRSVYEALCTNNFIDPDPEEPSAPSADELVMPSGWGIEEYLRSIVRLNNADADAMLSGAPRDWLSAL
jgi:hypothetical protein